MEFQADEEVRDMDMGVLMGFCFSRNTSKLQLAWCRSWTRHHFCAKRVRRLSVKFNLWLLRTAIFSPLLQPTSSQEGLPKSDLKAILLLELPTLIPLVLFILVTWESPFQQEIEPATSATTQSHKTPRCEGLNFQPTIASFLCSDKPQHKTKGVPFQWFATHQHENQLPVKPRTLENHCHGQGHLSDNYNRSLTTSQYGGSTLFTPQKMGSQIF